jgi:hypothetical protein
MTIRRFSIQRIMKIAFSVILTLQRLLIFSLIVLSLVLPATALSQSSGIAGIWAIDDCEKITQSDLTHSFISSANNAVWNGSTIQLFGAQNEIIAFQLIINATSSGASNVTVRLDSLIGSSYVITNTGGIGDPMNYTGKRIELFVESYINVTTKSAGGHIAPKAISPAYYSGQIPDGLVPFEVGQSKGGSPFNIASNVNQGVWVDIYIPKDAPPDLYSGKAIVYENGVVRYNIPVSLKVYGFALSDSTHFHNMFNLNMDDIKVKHGVSIYSAAYNTILDKYYKMCHRHRMDLTAKATHSAFNSYASGYYTGNAYTPSNGYEGPGISVGNGTYGIGVYDQPQSSASSGFTPVSESGWWAAADTWVSWFNANAPSTVIFKYMNDEPDSTQYALIQQRASWIHSNPGVGRRLKTYCTVKIDPRLYGYIDFWCEGGDSYVSSDVAARKSAGDKIAFYNFCRPIIPALPVIDVEAADSRVVSWIGWKYKLDQYFLWTVDAVSDGTRQINEWVDNYLMMGGYYVWGYANFLYTGQNAVFSSYDKGIPGPIASIRMKNWRRGQQDYEYLWLASQLGLQSKVDSIVNSIVPYAFDGYPNGQNSPPAWQLRGYSYERARKKIAELVGQTVRILNTTPSSLSFGDVAITTSSERSYTLSGINLIPASGNIIVTAPSTAFQVSLISGSGFSPSLNIPYTGGKLSSITIYVKFSPTAVQSYTGNVINSSVGASTQYVKVTGAGISTTTPTLTVSPTSLSFENVIINTNSIEQKDTIQGSNLSPAADSITITAPTGFTISTVSGSGFALSKKIAYTGGTLSATIIYVRFSPTAVQSYNSNITYAGGGATTKNVAVTGTGISSATPIIAINPGSLAFSTVRINTNSSERTYTVQGSYLLPASGNITITPPLGYQVSITSGSGFSSSLLISYTDGMLASKTIYVRFSPTAEQNYTGNITNAGGGATIQNVAVSGTGVSATSAALTVNPTSLSFGNVIIGALKELNYSLAGLNLTPTSDSLTLTASSGFTISTVSGSGFTSSKRIAYIGGILHPIPKVIYVKFSPTSVQNYFGNITNEGGGAAMQTVTISGSGINAPPPTLTINPTSLSFGDVINNTISGELTYILSGSNLLPASGSITITAPTGFQVSSTTGSDFNSSITVSYSNGTLSKTIYGRFLPTALQTYSGNITNTGGGATTNVPVSGRGVEPTITVSPLSLPFSSVVVNTTSSERTYTLSGSNLTPASDSLTITAPLEFTISTVSGSDFSSSKRIAYTGGVLSATTIYVKFLPTVEQSFSGDITNEGGGAVKQNVSVSGIGVSATTSLIIIDPTSLLFGNIQINTTSSRKIYTISGINLSPESGNVAVTAPKGFQVSTDSGSGFDSSLTIAYSGGILNASTINVRFYPTTAQIYTGNIANTGGGAAAENVYVSGSSVSPALTMIPDSLPFGNVIINTSSVKTYTLSGLYLQPVNDTVKIAAPIGFAISTKSDSGFNSSISIPYTNNTLSSTVIYIQFTPAAVQSYIGNITHSCGGTAMQNLPVSGESVIPLLTLSSDSVTFGNVLINTTSAELIYKIDGSNLTPASGNIIVTASYGFEVSLTSGSDFNSSINIPYSISNLSSTIIYVRFSPMTAISYTGNITNDGGGATTQIVEVRGTGANAPFLKIDADSLSFGSVIINATSEKSYTLSGAHLIAGRTIAITSPKGFQVSAKSGAEFDTSISILYSGDTLSSRSIYVRFAPTATENYSGNITNAGGGAPALTVAVSGIGLPLNMTAQVGQNYPNPFNPATRIPYSIYKKSWVKLTIYNILGQRIKTLINEEQDVGYYQPEFDISRDNNGQELSSGVYFYKLEVAGISYSKKLILLK